MLGEAARAAAVVVRVLFCARVCVYGSVDFADLSEIGGSTLAFNLMTSTFFLLLTVLDTTYGEMPLPFGR